MLGRDVLAGHASHLQHGLADAAGVVTHSSTGQPHDVAARMKAIPPAVAKKMIEELAPIAAQHTGAQS